MDFLDLFTVDQWIRSIPGGAHVLSAVVGLVLGPVVLARRKGDLTHRQLGRLWFVAMLIVNGSALAMYGFDGPPNLFHAFALLSLSALLPGYSAIRRYARTQNLEALRTHKICMHWAYFGLAAAGVWQLVARYAVLSNGFDYAATLWILILLTILASWGFGRWLNDRFPVPSTG